MIFKRREDAARDDYVGEARYVDPSEAITEVSDHTIDAVAEPQIVSPVATIGPSIVIKGEVTGDEDLLVEGRVEGAFLSGRAAGKSISRALAALSEVKA